MATQLSRGGGGCQTHDCWQCGNAQKLKKDPLIHLPVLPEDFISKGKPLIPHLTPHLTLTNW